MDSRGEMYPDKYQHHKNITQHHLVHLEQRSEDVSCRLRLSNFMFNNILSQNIRTLFKHSHSIERKSENAAKKTATHSFAQQNLLNFFSWSICVDLELNACVLLRFPFEHANRMPSMPKPHSYHLFLLINKRSEKTIFSSSFFSWFNIDWAFVCVLNIQPHRLHWFIWEWQDGESVKAKEHCNKLSYSNPNSKEKRRRKTQERARREQKNRNLVILRFSLLRLSNRNSFKSQFDALSFLTFLMYSISKAKHRPLPAIERLNDAGIM